MSNKLVVPKFKTETEEADWWFANRDKVSEAFVEAGRQGKLKVLTKEDIRERLAARPITIRVAEADLEQAKKQAC